MVGNRVPDEEGTRLEREHVLEAETLQSKQPAEIPTQLYTYQTVSVRVLPMSWLTPGWELPTNTPHSTLSSPPQEIRVYGKHGMSLGSMAFPCPSGQVSLPKVSLTSTDSSRDMPSSEVIELVADQL